MTEPAFDIDWGAAQAAKDSLGIEGPIEITQEFPLMDGANGYADLWNRRVILNALTPWRFASYALWHELAHFRQWQHDWDEDAQGMMHDYNYAWFWGEESPAALQLLPWEAEAHLTAYENRDTLLTMPGAAEPLQPALGWWSFFRVLRIDLPEIIEIGTEYRKVVRA